MVRTRRPLKSNNFTKQKYETMYMYTKLIVTKNLTQVYGS